jgi:hypothetical protein
LLEGKDYIQKCTVKWAVMMEGMVGKLVFRDLLLFSLYLSLPEN